MRYNAWEVAGSRLVGHTSSFDFVFVDKLTTAFRCILAVGFTATDITREANLRVEICTNWTHI